MRLDTFVPSVLLWMAGLDELRVDAQANPPDGQTTQSSDGRGGERNTVVGSNDPRETVLLEQPAEHGLRGDMCCGSETLASQNEPRETIGGGQGIAVHPVTCLEFTLEVNAPGVIDSVRQTLLAHWDPLRSRSTPTAHDEYDSYIPRIVRMLLDGADCAALSRRLESLERDSMGLGGYDVRCDRGARQLLIAFHTLLLCPELRAILDAELASDNRVVETSRGWPNRDSISIKLQCPVSALLDEIPLGVDHREMQGEVVHHRSGDRLAW